MTEQSVLFPGLALPRIRKAGTDNGYPRPPGSGPDGETCRSCAHYCRTGNGGKFLKCALLRARWTHGPGTDIKAKSPACELWAKPEP